MIIESRPSFEELSHFGIRGMKWGVRRNRKESSPKLSSDEKMHRAVRTTKIVVGAAIAARVLFVVGSMAAATVLHNRSAMEVGVRALGSSNMLSAKFTRGVFKVTSL